MILRGNAPLAPRPMTPIRAVFFDADGTLLLAENPYFHIARRLGCIQESKEFVRTYLNGEISYKELSEREQQLFNKVFQKTYSRLPVPEDFNRLLPVVSIRAGARQLIASIQRSNIEVFVLSSGIDTMVEELSRIGVPSTNIFANSFQFGSDSSGKKQVKRAIGVSGDKIDAFTNIIRHHNVSIAKIVYVGDNAFDRKILEFVRNQGGWTITLSTGEEKEAPLEGFFHNERGFTAHSLKDIDFYIKKIIST